MTETDVKRIEGKLDLIIDAFGLSNNRRLVPAEVRQISEKILLKFREKKSNAQNHEHKTD
jgi:hypothetical protein